MQFFFHVDSDTRVTDTEGEELASPADARVAAARMIAEMLKGNAHKFWGSRPWSITATDAAGLIYFTIELHGTNAPVCND